MYTDISFSRSKTTNNIKFKVTKNIEGIARNKEFSIG